MFWLLLGFAALQLVQIHGFSVQPRIINGHLSRRDQFPSFVFFHTAGSRGNKVMGCGGTLLSDRWVVTAAHCLKHRDDIFVYNGRFSIDAFNSSERVDSSKQHIYPHYDNETSAYDIGLIELSGKTKLSKHIQPAKLPANCTKLADYESVTAVGTGLTNLYQKNPDGLLRHAELFAVPPDVWTQTLKPYAERESLITAYSPIGKSICHGDSGGPLFRRADKTLIGVSSFVLAPLYKGEPTVMQYFTNIQYFYGWITQTTGIELPTC